MPVTRTLNRIAYALLAILPLLWLASHLPHVPHVALRIFDILTR